MHWIRPHAFWLMLFLIPIAIWFVRHRATGNLWSRVVDQHLLPHLLAGVNSTRHYGALFAFMSAWILAVITLAGPSWEQVQQPVLKSRQPLVILLDAQPSMLATDVKPSRFDRAKFKIIDLLRNRQEGEAALIAFTAEPYVVAPLTQDSKTIENLMPALSPEIMPAPGQNLTLALEQAHELLLHADQKKGDILVVSSGIVDIASALPLVKKLHDEGINTSVLTVGTETAAPIPDPRGGFLRDSEGKMLLANLDLASLRQLARTGGGKLAAMTVGSQDVHALARSTAPGWGETDQPVNEALYWRDEGHWLVFLLLPFVLVLFRRGVL